MCIYLLQCIRENSHHIFLINAPLDHERKTINCISNENIFTLTKMFFVMYFGKRADKGTPKIGWIEVKI